jgi:hypothetical protein
VAVEGVSFLDDPVDTVIATCSAPRGISDIEGEGVGEEGEEGEAGAEASAESAAGAADDAPADEG